MAYKSIYIVYAESGDYADYQKRIISIYDDKEMAQDELQSLNLLSRNQREHYDTEYGIDQEMLICNHPASNVNHGFAALSFILKSAAIYTIAFHSGINYETNSVASIGLLLLIVAYYMLWYSQPKDIK